MRTERQRKVIDQLLDLLYHRFNEESLNKRLSEIFGEEVKVSTECCDEDKEWNGDWYYTFGIESEELYGYFDIYYLKMREQPEDDDDGLRFFVTEVTYTFE